MINANYLIDLFKQNIGDSKVKFLSLKPGQLLNGQVIEIVDNNQALVSILGTKVLAKTEVPLTKGQNSMFMVTSTTSELRLKLLDDNGVPLTNNSVKNILEYLNIKNTKLNQNIISYMIDENIPIERNGVETIATVYNKNIDIQELLTGVKILHDKGLMLSVDNLRAVVEFYRNEGIAGKLINLNSSIEKYLQQKNDLPAEITKLLENTNIKINELLKEFNLFKTISKENEIISFNNSNNSGTKIPVVKGQEANFQQNNYQIKAEVNTQIVAEAKVNTQTVAGAKAHTVNNELIIKEQVIGKASVNNTVALPANSQELDMELSKLIVNDNKNISIINQQQLSEVKEVTGKPVYIDDNIQLQQKITSKDIMPILIKYLEEIQLKTEQGTQNQPITLKESIEQLFMKQDSLPQELVTGLEKTLQHLNGQNLLMHTDASSFSQAIIQFPGFSPYLGKPVYLHLNTKKDENNKLDKNDVLLAFIFDLDTLGDTIVRLHIVHDQLFMQILNNNPFIKEIFKLIEPDFLSFVKGMGYKTSGITFKRIESSEVKKIAGNPVSYQGVDLRI